MTISDYNSGGVHIPCNFRQNRLRIIPGIVGNGTTVHHNDVTVTNCSLAGVGFAQRPGIPVTLKMTNPTFVRDVQGLATFANFFGAQGAHATVAIIGGAWLNAPYWLETGDTGITWQISGLRPCPPRLHC